MKKMITIFLALVLVLSFAGCEKDTEKNPTTNTTNTTDVTEDKNTNHTEKPTEPSTEPTENTEPEHVHNYLVEKITVATCTGTGSTSYVCECGASYEDDYVEAYGHEWSDWVTVKEPTTTEVGTIERTCANCNEKETDELPKVVQGHTHEYTSKVTKAPTCTAEGVKTYTCSCGDTYTESIEKTNHNYKSKVTAPTCTDKGYTTYTCANCNHSYTENFVNAKDHNYKATVIAATCTNGGYTNHTCATCGHKYTDSKTNAKGHSWSAWTTTKEPTTDSTGIAMRKCTACGKTDEKVLDKLTNKHEHKYNVEVTKAATCTADGVKTYMCSCGDSYTEAIAKLGHNYKKNVVAPTCTERGYTIHTCGNCNDSYKDGYTNAKGHSYSSKVTATATCIKNGVKTYTCSSCKHSYTEEIAATGHNYTSKVTKAATCTADGVRTYTCSKCNGSYTENIAKLNHSYSATVVKPTCTAKGYTKHTCKTCSHSYNDTYVNATGHSYTSKVTAPTCSAQGYTTYTCSKCSNSYKDNYKSATGHVNTKTETKAAGCVTDGYTKVVCADCGTVISNKVVPSNGSHAYETMRLYPDAAAKDREMYGTIDGHEGYYEAKYRGWTDWNVQICRNCCEIDTSTIEFAYTDYEAAEIMLGYVNELREEVYGTDYYNLKLDPTLQELAQIRAKEIAENGMWSNGTDTLAFEMMRDGGVTIHEQFSFWTDTTAEVKSLTTKSYIYFGYGKYEINDTGEHSAGFYGIMLFWTGLNRSEYLYP